MKNKPAFLVILLLLGTATAVRLQAQTLGYSGGLCTGKTINIYIVGGSPCGNANVNSQSNWYISPTPSSITYVQSNGHYNQIQASWNSAVSVTVRATYTCSSSGSSGTTSNLNLSIGSSVTPSVTLALSSSTTVCEGNGSINLNATPTNGGSSPSYTYYVDGTVVNNSTSATYTYVTSSLATGTHTAYVIMSSSLACTTPSSAATSSTVSFTVQGKASYTATLYNPGTVCSGSPNFSTSVNVSGGVGNLSYQWYKNNSPITTTTVNYYTYSNVSQGDQVYCRVTSDYWCVNSPVNTGTLTVSVVASTTPTVAVQVPKLNYCDNESISFTAAGNNITGSSTYQWYLNGSLLTATTSTISLTARSTNVTGTFYPGSTLTVTVSGLSGTCLTTTTASSGSTPPLVITPYPTASFTPGGSILLCTTCSQTFTATTGSGYTYQWKKNGTALSGATASTYSTGTTGQAGTYSVAVSVNSCTSTSAGTVVQLNTVPDVNAGVDQNLVLPDTRTVTLSGNATDTDGTISTYLWTQLSGPSVILSGTSTPLLTLDNVVTGSYTFRLKAIDNLGDAGTDDMNLVISFPPNNYNYMREHTINVAGASTYAAATGLSIGNRSEAVTYYDGTGRLLQKVMTQASPQRKDVVQPSEYDEYGRERNKYLPYVTLESNGWYKANPLGTVGNYTTSPHYQFYSNGTADKVEDNTRPFSETVFESSPLQRPDKDYGPGADWYTANRFVKHQYLVNAHGTGTGQEKIICWTIDGSGNPVRSADNGGYYASGQLRISSTVDEQGYEVRTYTDKEGNTVLRKVQAVASPVLSSATDWAQTSYSYDDMGNLNYVLQPELMKTLGASDTANPNATQLAAFAFRYNYDGRGRKIVTQVPGAAAVYSVYDDRDRLVMTQDGEQRNSNQWSYIKYDALNRPVITGIHTHSTAATQAQMQTNVNDYYSSLVLPGSTGAWYESFTTGPDGVHGYDNKSFPTICTPEDCLTVTYYDNYDFKSQWGTEYNYTTGELTPVTVPNDNSTYSQASASLQVVGQITGTKVRTIDAAPSGNIMYLKSTIYYDDQNRPVQTISGNGMGGTDRTTTLYDFAGKTLAVKTTHVRNNFTWNNPGWFTATSSTVAYTGGGAAGPIATVQQLPANSNGTVEFTAGTSQNRALVWLGSGTDYFYLEQGYYYVKENGVTQTSGLFTSGDEFRIERVAGAYRYYVRNNLVYTATATSTAAYPVTVNLDRFQSDPSSLVNFSASFAQTSRTIKRTFTYDHAGRLLTTHHSINGATPILLAKNEYNELGQLVDKNLHSTDNGNTFKQSTDYRYNIRGWLTSINNSQLANDQVSNDDNNDLFGMNLLYNQQDAALNNASQYSGNISAMKWSSSLGQGTVKERGYSYTYDPLNRLIAATHKERSTTWATSTSYHEDGLSYDLNGNIKTLNRKGIQGATLDQLTYTYSGNQLVTISDAGDATKGFADVSNTTDYTYNSKGSMITDGNKGITAIHYNYLDLSEKITKSTGDYVLYSYDATGRKLSQQVYDVNNVLKKKTDYAGEYFYENDTLKFIRHEEGRVVMTGAQPEYQYLLKDHLGNVRVTFTTKNTKNTYTATLEDNTQTTEQTQFNHYSRVTNDLYDHTDAGTVYNKVQLLNGGYNSQIGLTKSLSVMPGDTVRAEVYAKYFGTTGSSGNMSGFATALLSAFGLPNPAAGEIGTAASAINNYGAFIAAGNNPGTNGWPKGWLNVLVFDKNYNLVDLAFQQLDGAYVQSGAIKAPHQLLSKQVIIKEPGFVYIYVSNEGNVQQDVYFDDFNVTHAQSPLVQQQEYYAFGMQTSNSYVRENSMLQNFLYNGKELQDELNIGWYDYDARMYMSDIGRWGVVDPLAEQTKQWSAYTYGYNNPVRFTDPTGMSNEDATGGGDKKDETEQRREIYDKDNKHYVDIYYGSDESGSVLSYNGYFGSDSGYGGSQQQMQSSPGDPFKKEDKWNNDMFDKWPSFWKTAMGKDIKKALPIAGNKWNNDMFDKWPSFWKTAMGKDIIKTFPILGPSKNRAEIGNMAEDTFLDGLLDGVLDQLPSKLWPFKIPIFIPDEWEKPVPPLVTIPK